jgi:hypothetical protein
MMKQLLLSILLAVCFLGKAQAQIIIYNTDFILSTTGKDSIMIKLMKKTGAALPIIGMNQTWDYSTLRDSLAELYYYGYITQPVTTPRNAAFASATLQADHFTFFQNFPIRTRSYYQVNSAGYGRMGDSISRERFTLTALTGSASDSLTILAGARTYGQPVREYRFPMTMGTAWTSNQRVTTDFLLKVGAFALNNVPGQAISRVTNTDSIVGWGTLRMRHPSTGATLNFNVLLNYFKYETQDSFYLGGAPAPAALLTAFGLVQGARDSTIRYNFIGPNFKAPYVQIQRNKGNNGIDNIFRSILPNLGLTVKNNELTNLEVKTTVFPNPTTEGVTFEFDKQSAADWRVFVYNTAGQIIKNEVVIAPIGVTQYATFFERNLPNGTYFYQILDDNSLIRNSGKVILTH